MKSLYILQLTEQLQDVDRYISYENRLILGILYSIINILNNYILVTLSFVFIIQSQTQDLLD